VPEEPHKQWLLTYDFFIVCLLLPYALKLEICQTLGELLLCFRQVWKSKGEKLMENERETESQITIL